MTAKLSQLERDVLEVTAQLVDEWNVLPDRTEDDDRQFTDAVHSVQQLVGMRVARRADPDVWRQP